MIVGNDVSQFQGQIDWDTYHKNAHFAIIKATEGNGFADPQFFRNQNEARRVGIPVGYYHFARPDLGNSPLDESTWFLKTVGKLQPYEVLCLDFEVTYQDCVAWCKSFLDKVFAQTNTRPLIYLNQNLVTSFDWTPVVAAGYALWIAAYTFDPNKNTFQSGAFNGAAIQQWTDEQTVPGIEGVVDGDVFFGDIAAFKKYGYQPPVPVPPTPVNPMVTISQKELDEIRADRDQNYNCFSTICAALHINVLPDKTGTAKIAVLLIRDMDDKLTKLTDTYVTLTKVFSLYKLAHPSTPTPQVPTYNPKYYFPNLPDFLVTLLGSFKGGVK